MEPRTLRKNYKYTSPRKSRKRIHGQMKGYHEEIKRNISTLEHDVPEQSNPLLQLTLNNISEDRFKIPHQLKALPYPAGNMLNRFHVKSQPNTQRFHRNYCDVSLNQISKQNAQDEIAESNETPEQLNDRLQRALQSMSTNVTSKQKQQMKVSSEYILQANNQFDNTFTNASEVKTDKQNIQVDFEDPGIVHQHLSVVRSNETLEEMTRDSTNETTNAPKCMTDIKLNKSEDLIVEPKNESSKISDVRINKQSEDDQLGHSELPQSTIEINSETSESRSDFESLLCFFLKQEHKPPYPETVKTAENTKSTPCNIDNNSDTQRDNRQLKPNNIYDHITHEDLANPFKRIEVSLEDGKTSEEINDIKSYERLKPDLQTNALDSIVNEPELENAILCKTYDEIKALHTFEACPPASGNIQHNVKVPHENVVRVKGECSVEHLNYTPT